MSSFTFCYNLNDKKTTQISQGKLLKLMTEDKDPKNTKKNKTLAMFVLLVNSISLDKFKGDIKVPQSLMKFVNREQQEEGKKKKKKKPKGIARFLVSKLKKIPYDKIEWVDALPRLEDYFVEVITSKSTVFRNLMSGRDRVRYLSMDAAKKYKRRFTTPKEKFIRVNDARTKNVNVTKTAFLLNNTRNVNFKNPDYSLLQYLVFTFLTNRDSDAASFKKYKLFYDKVWTDSKVEVNNLRLNWKDSHIVEFQKRVKAYVRTRTPPQKIKPKPKPKPKPKKNKKKTESNISVTDPGFLLYLNKNKPALHDQVVQNAKKRERNEVKELGSAPPKKKRRIDPESS